MKKLYPVQLMGRTFEKGLSSDVYVVNTDDKPAKVLIR